MFRWSRPRSSSLPCLPAACNCSARLFSPATMASLRLLALTYAFLSSRTSFTLLPPKWRPAKVLDALAPLSSLRRSVLDMPLKLRFTCQSFGAWPSDSESSAMQSSSRGGSLPRTQFQDRSQRWILDCSNPRATAAAPAPCNPVHARSSNRSMGKAPYGPSKEPSVSAATPRSFFASCSSTRLRIALRPSTRWAHSDVIVNAGALARPQCDKDNFSSESQPLQSSKAATALAAFGRRHWLSDISNSSNRVQCATSASQTAFTPFAFNRQFLTIT